MAEFTDSIGRKWIVNINWVTIEEVKKTIDYDLLKVDSDGALVCIKELIDNPGQLVTVLYALLIDQVTAYKLDERQFAEGMLGTALDEAHYAVCEGIANFFPSPKRQLHLGHLEKHHLAMKEMLEEMTACLTNGKFEEALKRQKTRLGKQYAAIVESLGSQTLEMEHGEKSGGQ